MSAPLCLACSTTCRLTTGREIYPRRPNLAEKRVWVCDGCRAYVGCHEGTIVALGTPAGPELRAARTALHQIVDPIWRNADRLDAYSDKKGVGVARDIQKVARIRTYDFLRDRLGLTPGECHVAMFDLATCERAAKALEGVDYGQIRAWAHERRERRAA